MAMAISLTLFWAATALRPSGCPEANWTGICRGSATCESLSSAGLTCGGVQMLEGALAAAVSASPSALRL